jgi:hypothetical protein
MPNADVRVLLVLRRLLGVEDGLLEARAQVGDLAGGRGKIGLFGHAFHPIERSGPTVGGFAQGVRRSAVARRVTV